MSSNNKDFILGTIIGGIVGAVTAMLLAPKSGKELRSDLNEQAILVKDKSLQFKDTALEKGNEWISVAKEKSTDIAKTVSEQSSQVADKVKEVTDRIKSIEIKSEKTPSNATTDASALENSGNSDETNGANESEVSEIIREDN